MSNRYQYVYFICEHIYYDALEEQYVCASNGKRNKRAGGCKRCPHLKTMKSETHKVDLREVK